MTSSNSHRSTTHQVAMIGTGTMGAAMARRLLDARMDVAVWSRHPASTKLRGVARQPECEAAIRSARSSGASIEGGTSGPHA